MNTLFSLVSEPFAYPFMQRAIVAAIITGVVCAVLSCYLVLKGWSLMGDAISHAVLPGIVLAFWLGIPLVIGAFISGIFCAVATGYLKENSRVKEDTVMGIVFSGMFAFGLVLFSRMDTDQHLSHILFGNMLGISLAELKQTLWIAGFTLLVVLLKRKDFMLYCFDPNHARVIGLPVKLLHYGLLCLLALTIVASLQAVGVILVIAMLISPGIIAFMVCRSFDQMLVVATLASVLSCVLGTLISFHIDGATGPCIVIIQALFFVIALIYSHIKPTKGRPIALKAKDDGAKNTPRGNLL
ncbi:iron/manganese ABC transporter permease subunit YfeD [Yersinia kristensenii]|uniref:Chelated iron transport system membrane protein n=1 Tax=Yersinia kristensenii TaxID=28152 RepID=A0A0T9KRH4_YERKR|nr:iron/manganese ABC transporter permease subunit YfeD [Yersinia kristensenii]MBW5813916.1 iron/manganese ABC transporter permease subunit YfeD [Yersinia kristensenii]MBW5816742.1 iron/manganese ABC transporter permease subunit YfeD [Yersinia kristensenii]MBW5826707.1 iron/manganese ABC transporter permease subunit YfeD [Yersinia kristensenii]MBW5831104.1 iron/manganese ABC transporter permease subunit YfeD [Yersinia kristensenii]MBW5843938.1 iron/manganese ABC transporter permease subunit Yf